MKELVHFYHVYADGAWEEPLRHHVEMLDESGLMDELSDMFVGIVGSAENRAKVKRVAPGVVVAEEEIGWEQATLNHLHCFSKSNDAYVLYAHTKGASSNDDLAKHWRISMTHDVVGRWRECVRSLGSADAAGAFWLNSNMPEHATHKSFFAGNFWWATTDYLRRLGPISTESRYSAEGWIGLGEPNVHVMRPGASYWGNFWQPHS
jgi:hypothetical protein